MTTTTKNTSTRTAPQRLHPEQVVDALYLGGLGRRDALAEAYDAGFAAAAPSTAITRVAAVAWAVADLWREARKGKLWKCRDLARYLVILERVVQEAGLL